MKKINLLIAFLFLLIALSCSKEDSAPIVVLPQPSGFNKVTTNLPKVAFHQSVVFQNKIWVIGGVVKNNAGQEVYTSTIFSSTNGVNFTNHGSGPFANRGYHQVLVYNNKLWLFGGVDATPTSTTVYNDIWSSTDGITWTQVNPIGLHFGYRYGHQMVVYDNKMWCIGGYNQTNGIVGDVWFSSDGQIWNKYNVTGNWFGNRALHSLSVFNNQLLLIGGNSSYGRKNDLWVSTNGNSWLDISVTGGVLPDREAHITVVKNGKFYVIGGSADNKVWESKDNVGWTSDFKIGNLDGNLVGHQALLFQDKIHVIGGLFENNNYSSDIYKSNF